MSDERKPSEAAKKLDRALLTVSAWVPEEHHAAMRRDFQSALDAAAAEAYERVRQLESQKAELRSARVALTEALGATATVLYRESAKELPSRQALRAEAKRLDTFLLQHRTIRALAKKESER